MAEKWGNPDFFFKSVTIFFFLFVTVSGPKQEELAVADGIPEFLKKSIVLQTFGVRSPHVCQEVEHVLIPPYVSPEGVRSTQEKARKRKGKRDIFAFFRGKMELHPKNISGLFYGK